jgi:sterol desaturase/sphingolipid hydroxylase (fatty acid hydroxylase superfamily)
MSMGLLRLEHSKVAYIADFAFYGTAVPTLAFILAVEAPGALRAEIVAITLLGLFAWTAIEYAIHRFVLHGLQPFKSWHAEHHRRPTALICAPTMFSATLITSLVFLPAWALGNVWGALALTLGVLGGYLAYGVTHHATHHWRADSAWLKRRKRAHALHHHADTPACYGVTSAFWDHVFRSARRREVTA